LGKLEGYGHDMWMVRPNDKPRDAVSIQQCPCKALPLTEASRQEYVGR